jgi:MtaA/CmuA family methyltransferase
MSRSSVLKALRREGGLVVGTGTSIVCKDLMAKLDTWFPQAHMEPEAMARLAIAGYTELGMDIVMPLFSVCHEASAMGCNVHWGGPEQMPESGRPIFSSIEDIHVPADLLDRPGCKVPLKAIGLLRSRLGEDAAVCGKVFGPWTQAYHYFGVENFLMLTMDDASAVEQIMEALMPVTISFARAQIDAGADCILLGDHATRDLCSPASYERFLKPVHARLAKEINAPVILHICGDTSDRIGMISQTGLDSFHYDTKTGSPQKVRSLAGPGLALMGGVSNYTLLRGSPQEISAMARQAVLAGIDIVGPECAVPLLTPIENLKAIREGVAS